MDPEVKIIAAGKKKFRLNIYILGFLVTLASALPSYINSTYLRGFISESKVGLTYSLSSVIAIIIFFFLPSLLKKFGNFKTSLISLALLIVSFITLAISQKKIFVILAFCGTFLLLRLLGLLSDIFLENNSDDSQTGGIRGAYLTITNFSWLIAPMLTGFIVGTTPRYKLLFAICGIILGLVFVLTLRAFRNFTDPSYDRVSVKNLFKRLKNDGAIRKITLIQVLLNIFYAVMVIYTPLYLHDHIGLDWSAIGKVFSVMLLPFVLLEYPLGKMEDLRFGEKELLIAGFCVMAVSTALLSFFTSTNLIVWALILFTTRVGAATVEVSSESYFFKHVNSKDANLLGLFRMASPAAYVVAPILASIFLTFVDFRHLFLALSVIILLGVILGIKIKDTM